MAKAFLALLLLAFIPSFLAGNEPQSNAEKEKKILYILPFTDLSDQNTYKTSGLVKIMLFKSLYNFMSMIPLFDVPEEESLSAFADSMGENGVSKLDGYANWVILGSMECSGNKNKPNVRIHYIIQWQPCPHRRSGPALEKGPKTYSGVCLTRPRWSVYLPVRFICLWDPCTIVFPLPR